MLRDGGRGSCLLLYSLLGLLTAAASVREPGSCLDGAFDDDVNDDAAADDDDV